MSKSQTFSRQDSNPLPIQKNKKLTITFVILYSRIKKMFCDRTPAPRKELYVFSCNSSSIKHDVGKSVGPFVGLSVVNLIVAGKYFQMY